MPEVIVNTSPIQYLTMTGTLGVLLKAKQTGRLKAVEPALDHLEALGFYLDATTRAAVLKLIQK